MASTGSLTQLGGTDACITSNGADGCFDGKAMLTAVDTAISPDGRHVYLAGLNQDAVSILSRDPVTGALTQNMTGDVGCIAETTLGGACIDGRSLDDPNSIVVSPDGAHVYVTASASDAVAVLDRDETTGALSQSGGALSGCISDTGAGPCQDGKFLESPDGIAISPDGLHLYVASENDDAVAVLKRDPASGDLTQDNTDGEGCISDGGSSGSCVTGRALNFARAVVISPDGAHVYVTSTGGAGSVATLVRNQTTGELSQSADPEDGCVSGDGAGPCGEARAMSYPIDVALSPDGASAYVIGLFGDGVAVFDRNPATGALTQKAGTAGCLNDPVADGCAPAVGTNGPTGAVVSPDGRSVYVAGQNTDVLAIFDRDPLTGALAQQPGSAGCVSNDGFGGLCVDGRGLNGVNDVVVSPDGLFVYANVYGSGGAAAFAREPYVPPTPPLELTLKAKKKQRAEKIRAKLTCSNACDATVRGKGRAGGIKVKTKRVTTDLEAGVVTKVRLKIRSGLLRKIEDERGKLRLKASATDAAGQADSAKTRLKLKP